jgi:hypothetical protein
MEHIIKTKRKNIKRAFSVLLISVSASAFATSPTSGQLVVINSLGTGKAKSSVLVTVNDASGPCSTTTSLAYNGIIVIPWNVTNTHSTTKCTGISSVDVSALKTADGVVQYDSTANATPPVKATAATAFTAPTTPITNLVLIVTGNTSPAMTNSATSWGSALGVSPIFSAADGSLVTTGIMGGVGIEGMKASKQMLKRGIRPAGEMLYTVTELN